MDKEERNYCSLILLLTRVGLPKIRDFFIQEWNAIGGFDAWTDCHQNGTDLLTKYTPHPPYEKPKVQLGDSTKWDLSLFVKVLLKSRPPLVPSSEKRLVAGLKCLTDTRNKVCHTPTGKIATPEFHNLKSSVCNALLLIGATSEDFKKVKKDVNHQTLNELLSMVKHCSSQDKEILKGIDTIKQGQQEIKEGQLVLQQGQQEIKEGQSVLQQGQQEIKEGQSVLQQGQQEIKQGHEKILKLIKDQDKPSTAMSSNLSPEDVAFHSKGLKSSTKAQTEFQPKLMASHSVPSTRTDEIFTNLMIQRGWKPLRRFKSENVSRCEQLEEYTNPSDKCLIDKCQDIFINPDQDDPNPKSILVTGKPGIGKSLFCQRLSRDWADGVLFHDSPDASRAPDDFDFVYLMTFRQLNLFGAKEVNFCEVLNHCSMVDEHSTINESLFEYIIEHPEKVLFILDGYDEYSNRSRIYEGFEQNYKNNPRVQMPVAALISKLLRKKIFTNAVVMVTSRPTEADELGDIHMNAVVEIAGFSVEQVKDFIEKYFKSKKEEVRTAARDHIMNNENLLSLAHIPVLCHLMCFCLEWHIENGAEKCLPTTITELYSEVVEIFETFCKPIHRASEEKSTMNKLAELAAAMFKEGKFIFDQSDIDKFQLTCPETGNLQSFGLLTCGPAFRESPSKITRHFCFSHLTLHEYFAACGFVNSGIIPTVEGNEMVLQFCAGLLSKVKDGQSVMEEMITPYCKSKHGLLVAKCLREYGAFEFGLKIIEKYHTAFCYSLRDGILFNNKLYLSNSIDCVALAYFLDLISTFCRDQSDTSRESFCRNRLRLQVSEEAISGIKQIAESLKNDCCPITALEFDSSTYFCNNSINQRLILALPGTHITTLHLCGLFIDEEIPSLSDVLPKTDITTLRLNGDISDEGMSSLSNVLPSTHITTLHIGDYFADDRMFFFSIRNEKITDKGMLSLSYVLPSTHITTLHLEGDFTYKGMSLLSNVLPSTLITTLDLEGDITDEGMSLLSNVIPSTHIATLLLKSSSITDIGMLSLSKVLPSTHITTLNLSGDFTCEGVTFLCNVLPSTHITTLHLGGDISDEGMSSLSNVLPSTHITTLRINGLIY